MAVIPLRVHRMKKKLEKMQLKERLIYGYGRVILRMIVSGVLSLIVIGSLMGNMLRYVDNVERADVAVKICRIDVNSAARNIREMALNSDTSTYDSVKSGYAILDLGLGREKQHRRSHALFARAL